MLQNAYFLAKIGVDTAENERNFAENLPKLPTTLRLAAASSARSRAAAGPGSARRAAALDGSKVYAA